jgi:hypothetical protein
VHNELICSLSAQLALFLLVFNNCQVLHARGLEDDLQLVVLLFEFAGQVGQVLDEHIIGVEE